MVGPDKQNAGPLSGLRALDLTGELGWLLGRILADLGVEVVKIDPPGGDPGKGLSPLIEGPLGAVSAAWIAFNMGKSRLDLDLNTLEGQSRFLELAGRADFVLESTEPGMLDRLGIGWNALHERNPSLILTSVTPYGQEGPLAGVPASDLEIMAAGGAIWLTGDADRPPVRVSLPQAACWAGSYAAIGTLIAYHYRQLTGEGQHVDMSAQAGVVPALVHAPSYFDFLGENPMRAGGYLVGRNVNGAVMRNIWPCRDGYVAFAVYGGQAGRQSNRGLVEWMTECGVAPNSLKKIDWDTFDVTALTKEEVTEIEEAIAPFFETITKAEFSEQATARRILGYIVATTPDIASDPQLEEREVWSEAFVPEIGKTVRFPDGWLRIDGERYGLISLARQDTSTSLDLEEKAPVPLGIPKRKGALGDLRIVELGGYGAGPGVGKLFAEHGAEVIRIESRLWLDGFRTNYPPFKDNIAGPERAAMFAITNDSKLSVSLNLKTSEGRDLAVRLIERADVLIENFAPGTTERLGLGHKEMATRNKKLITLSTSNQGRSGPQAKRVGFGTHLSSLSGFTELTGWPDRQPVLLWGPYIDYIAVAYGAAAVLAALERRRQSGVGCHIDLSQYECGLQFLAPALIQYFANGEVSHRIGNRDPNAVPHGIFPCSGKERWCAISIHDDAEWERFVNVVGEPWVKDLALASVSGRRAREEQLEQSISTWTAHRSREEVVDRLREGGVHTALVNDMADLFKDPQLTYRQMFHRLDHPVIGEHFVPGPPFKLSVTPAEISHSAPTLGQHNEVVLCDILGLSSAELEKLQVSGALE